MRETVKCYSIQYSTENEAMFDELRANGFIFTIYAESEPSGYFDIEIKTSRLRELEDIMKWYV